MSKVYETVIGLEVHVELATKTKIFCGCSTAFGGAPNTHTCPVCTGMPGSLPVLNKGVVEKAIAVGLATNCTITQNCKFDRKNYFYPDNPQNYQISQLYYPICRNGKIEIEVETLEQVKEAVEAGADIIMLDNMTPEVMKQAVELINGRAQTECSGNITKENIQKIREIGVDFVSSGALTHSAPILDISMKNLHAV